MSEDGDSKPLEQKFSSKVIGIDLGTVNSCVSVLDDDGKPIVIDDSEGHATQPSVFAFSSNRDPLVGRAALAQQKTNRLNTIFAIKRLIGRKFDSEAIGEARGKLPYKIIEANNGDAWVEIDDEPFSPEQVSSSILVHMKEIAEQYLGERVNKAVITVPAHFNDSQRQATRDAGDIAGLKVLNMINEPTAAALAYGLNLIQGDDVVANEKIIAVFDLGGGTFDVTILGLQQGRFEVKSTNGDTYLGGEDFDLALVNYLLDAFKSSEGIDLAADKAVMQRLKAAAKNAKHKLSDEVEADVVLENVSSGGAGNIPKSVSLKLNRKELEKIFSHLVSAIDSPCKEAMQDAGVTSDEIDEVILVGGMTRMPLIKKSCERIFGKKPIDEINPDTAVADGAAIQAALMQGMLEGLSLQDVTSLAFGIEVQGGKVVTMLEKNTKIPCVQKQLFTTSSPNQREINLHVVQGEGSYAVENKSLGLFSLDGIPEAPRGEPNIELILEVDEDGIIHVAAKDLDSGQAKKIDILPSSGLGEEERQKFKKENEQHRNEEARREKVAISREQELRKKLRSGDADSDEAKVVIEAQAKLKAAIFALQFKLDMEGIAYRGDKRAKLEEILRKARSALEQSGSLAQIFSSIAEIYLVEEEFDEFLDMS